jgi:hypothetical protein
LVNLMVTGVAQSSDPVIMGLDAHAFAILLLI